ncbi:MAG: hypothetical protein K6G90_09135 [Clostridia bacterium]|nr:hypothetical protein [Clostridia bacterium]
MKKAIALMILLALSITICFPTFAHSGTLTNTFDKTTRNGITYIGTEQTG